VFINIRRRLIAASASVLLAFGIFAVASAPAHASTPGITITGRVLDANGKPKPYVRIAVFKLNTTTGDWEDIQNDRDTVEGTSKHPEWAGTFNVPLLELGTYRVAFNLGLNGQVVGGGEYLGQYYNDTTSPDLAESIVLTEESPNRTGVNATLHYSGGTISGTVKDSAGVGIGFAEVGAYDADRTGDTEGPLWHQEADFHTTTDANGHYTLRTHGAPIKLHFLQDSDGFEPEWYDDKANDDDADATVLSAGPGEAVVDQDAVLTTLPLVNTTKPSISGDLFVGGTARADEGDWSSHSATYTFQWYRLLSNGTEIKLTNGIHQTYKLNSHDYGHQLRVIVTASQNGTDDVEAASGKSSKAKLGSKISFSTSSSSRGKVTAHATVYKSTGSHASGKIRFSCGNSHLTYDSSTATLKSGKASATLSVIPKGTKTCTAKYYGSSTVAGTIKTDTVKVK
jgi:protocatechuate 3,4-dioxygenase beta subunit